MPDKLTKDEFMKEMEKLTKGKEYILNPDKDHLDFVINGIMEIEAKKGLKYCPCRLTMGDPVKDMELLCPCDFFDQETYKNDDRCWCGLFVKR